MSITHIALSKQYFLKVLVQFMEQKCTGLLMVHSSPGDKFSLTWKRFRYLTSKIDFVLLHLKPVCMRSNYYCSPPLSTNFCRLTKRFWHLKYYTQKEYNTGWLKIYWNFGFEECSWPQYICQSVSLRASVPSVLCQVSTPRSSVQYWQYMRHGSFLSFLSKMAYTDNTSACLLFYAYSSKCY